MKHENQSWHFLLKWKKKDLYICLSSIIPIVLIWIYLFFNESLENVLTYSNAGQYMYVSKHFYNVLDRNGQIDSDLLANARILPVTPTCIFILHFLTFGSWNLAAFLYILITAFLASFFFNRLLYVFKVCSSCMFYYSIALSIYPMRYIVYRSVVNSDSLYLCLAFIALISARISSFKILFISAFLALLTNSQGIVLFLSILSYLFFDKKKDRNEIFHFFLIFPLAFISLGIIQSFFMKSFFGYFTQEFINSDEYCPFVSIFLSCFEVDKLWKFHGQFMYYAFGFIGILFLSMKSTFLSIHLVFSFLYLILLKYGDVFHQGIQFEIFAILGFEEFLTSKNVKKILPLFLLIYGAVGLYIANRSIDYS